MFSRDAANYYLRRILRLPSTRSLDEAAVKRIEIAPPETRKNRPTIVLPDKLLRVRAFWSDTNIELESERLSDSDRKHRGTYAYLFENATMVGGNLFAPHFQQSLLSTRKRNIFFKTTYLQGEHALSTSLYGNIYWGHWLLDDCLKYLLARDYGACVAPLRPPYAHQPGYEKLLDMRVNYLDQVQFEHLWVFDDVGQNSSKRERYRILRESLLAAIGKPNPEPHPGIYLTRGMAGSRRFMINEQHVADHLAKKGFTVLDPMQTDVETILRASAGARIVAGIEGSGLAHAIALMAPETTLLVINPPNRFNNVYKDMTDCMDTNYAVVMGVLKGDDFYTDLDELDQTLELIENRP